MLISDRVICDCCGNDMGKLMSLPARKAICCPICGCRPISP